MPGWCRVTRDQYRGVTSMFETRVPVPAVP